MVKGSGDVTKNQWEAENDRNGQKFVTEFNELRAALKRLQWTTDELGEFAADLVDFTISSNPFNPSIPPSVNLNTASTNYYYYFITTITVIITIITSIITASIIKLRFRCQKYAKMWKNIIDVGEEKSAGYSVRWGVMDRGVETLILVADKFGDRLYAMYFSMCLTECHTRSQ